MKKGGRPKLKKLERKDFTYRFRVNTIERDKFISDYLNFVDENRMKNFTMTDYIKMKIFNKEKTLVAEKNTSSVVWELNKIGVNVNQIAKKINTEAPNKYDDELAELQSKLNEMVDILKNLL